jgi:hypothetical protein
MKNTVKVEVEVVTIDQAYKAFTSGYGKVSAYAKSKKADTIKAELTEKKASLQKEGKWIHKEDQENFRRFQSAVLMAIGRKDSKAKAKAKETEKGEKPESDETTAKEGHKTTKEEYVQSCVSVLKLAYALNRADIETLFKQALDVSFPVKAVKG